MPGVDQYQLDSELAARGLQEVMSHVTDMQVRVRYGDATLGWRGDDTMRLVVNPHTERFEVYAIDRGGNPYLAAAHPDLSPALLVKLRDGDPQRGDPYQAVLDHNAKLAKDEADADREKIGEIGEKMQWAIRQDFSQHTGGRQRIWHMGGETEPVPSMEGTQ